MLILWGTLWGPTADCVRSLENEMAGQRAVDDKWMKDITETFSVQNVNIMAILMDMTENEDGKLYSVRHRNLLVLVCYNISDSSGMIIQSRSRLQI